MIKKIWIIIFNILMYGGCGLLFLSFLLKWDMKFIIASIVIIVLSLAVAFLTLKCPHCKKLTIPTKSMLTGLFSGKCTCSYCGKDIEVK